MISLLVFGGIGTVGVLSLIGWCWRKAKREDAVASDRKLLRKINAGTYRIPPEKVDAVWAAIRGDHMRPMGVPSTVRDVEYERLAREARRYRAIYGIDHAPRVVIEVENSPANDGFAAHEILTFCCGGEE